ncbi:hypothetical protein NVP1121O_198 [Vibrio phage 1.121.O._10N.286.46.C4]|nr:hypothetical protein NVP1121O_198 [Vibrio phage 1.121.O._10N.286.46.C4]
MDKVTKKFVEDLYTKHAGFVPRNEDEFMTMDTCIDTEILIELLTALNIFVDNEEGGRLI